MSSSTPRAPVYQPESATLNREPALFASWGFSHRAGFLACLFTLELLAITTWLDTASLSTAGLIGLMGHYGPPALRSLVTFAVIFVALGLIKAKDTTGQHRDREWQQRPIGWWFLAGHVAVMAGFAVMSARLFGSGSYGPQAGALASAWLAAGILGIALLIFAVFPPHVCAGLLANTGYVWVPSAIAGILASVAGPFARGLWKPAVGVTFSLVKTLLTACTSDVIANPANATIGTSAFSVEISPQCSGLEGTGLMVVFGVVWLWLFRRDYRFPQALLLLPAGVTILFGLNAFRIAALILIGNAGAPRVALGGFHSQAGWIAFNAVALGLSLAAPHVPWVSRRGSRPKFGNASVENPTAAYLVPFLTILAATMVSRATAAGFEWLYPLRFFAAASALWLFRRKYAELDWGFGWLAPVTGVAVFVMWMALDRTGAHSDNGIAAGLAGLSSFGRAAWLLFRVLAATVTVPIAEELVFRAFLIRRLIREDFESLDFRRFTVAGVLISSVAFGLLHGGQWLAATGAGLLYATVFLRRGRIGDAAIAHATTNALIAAAVLARGQWHLW